MAAPHVRDLAAHKVFSLENKCVGDLGLVVGIVAIPEIPVDAERIPIGIDRNSRERDVVILIHRRGRGEQLQLGCLITVECADIHHNINPGHIFPVLTLCDRRDMQTNALFHKGAANHERRIQHPTCAAGRSIKHHGQRPRTLHQQLETVTAPVVKQRIHLLFLPHHVDKGISTGRPLVPLVGHAVL